MSLNSTTPAIGAPREADRGIAREAGLVGAGGACGALARSAIAGLCGSLGWPELAATQIVNLAGAVALGVLVGLLERRGPHPQWRAFLGVGVLGSFTTFSALVDEGLGLAGTTSTGVALAYLTGSLALGIAGFWLGERAGGRCSSRAPHRHDQAVGPS